MNKTISNLHKNRVFTLLVWLIIVFIAIISAPSITTTLQSYSQPTFSTNSQPARAAKLHQQWGAQLGKTTQINIVYENPHGQLTAKQVNAIRTSIDKLKRHQSFYNIRQITTPDNNLSGRSQMLSKDGSTQLVLLAIDADQNLRVLVGELTSQVKVAGLKSYVTSRQLFGMLIIKKWLR
ncbi:hypothetical protein [Lentilactobacillus farraginis]|uniref:Membrane protein n=1 Tax=Lentilactobacillus farraginis DSM 18382 = JCM 14108 TaxID=1423743 RepID=X0PHV7_9LACO|nr:hypothetical protein [Lentilactobacillus farraginis]GAF36652.1 membrane protein [Lentilactobacillus farraginis DSM 18382 = JCM 14108]